jgi:hypothetical protein
LSYFTEFVLFFHFILFSYFIDFVSFRYMLFSYFTDFVVSFRWISFSYFTDFISFRWISFSYFTGFVSFRSISFSYFTDFVGFCFRFVSFRFFSFLSLPVPCYKRHQMKKWLDRTTRTENNSDSFQTTWTTFKTTLQKTTGTTVKTTRPLFRRQLGPLSISIEILIFTFWCSEITLGQFFRRPHLFWMFKIFFYSMAKIFKKMQLQCHIIYSLHLSFLYEKSSELSFIYSCNST